MDLNMIKIVKIVIVIFGAIIFNISALSFWHSDLDSF